MVGDEREKCEPEGQPQIGADELPGDAGRGR
jgi:hypothetical protein